MQTLRSCPRKKGSTSFLKKRSKKLLFLGGSCVKGEARIVQPLREIKVFWFFSSEQNMLATPNFDFAGLS